METTYCKAYERRVPCSVEGRVQESAAKMNSIPIQEVADNMPMDLSPALNELLK